MKNFLQKTREATNVTGAQAGIINCYAPIDGDLEEIYVKIANASGDITLQARVNGVVAEDEFTISAGVNVEAVVPVSPVVAVLRGQIIRLDATGLENTAFAPITVTFRIEDGITVPVSGNLDDLDDVTAPTPSDGDVLSYDLGSGDWINTAPTAGATALDDLTDVVITTPATGDIVKYSGTQWENVPDTGGISADTEVFSADIPYATPSTEDDEFNAGSLDAKWTAFNVAPQVAFNVLGQMEVLSNAGSPTQFHGYTQTLTPGANREWVMRVRMPVSNSGVKFGFIMLDTAGGRWLQYVNDGNGVGADGTAYREQWTNNTTVFLQNNEGNATPHSNGTFFMKLKYTHSTKTIDLQLSADGVLWRSVGSGNMTFALDKIGFCHLNSTTEKVYVDWFRRVQGSYIGGYLAGDKGDTGAQGDGALKYQYSTTVTDTNPGTGFLLFDNTTLASAVRLNISETDADGNGLAAYLQSWDDSTSTIKGVLTVRKETDPSVFQVFSVTGSVSDQGAYDKLTVASVVANGSLTNGDYVRLSFYRTGDTGTTGATGAGAVGILAARRTGATAYDDEFDGTSLDAKWTATGTTPSFLSFNDYIQGAIAARFNPGQDYNLSQTFVPGSGAFSVTLCGNMELKEAFNLLVLRLEDSTNANALECASVYSSGQPKFTYSKRVASSDTFEIVTHNFPSITNTTLGPQQFLLHIQRDGGGTWQLWHSFDGIYWFSLATAHSQTITVGKLKIFFGTNTGATTKVFGCIHWVRENWLTF